MEEEAPPPHTQNHPGGNQASGFIDCTLRQSEEVRNVPGWRNVLTASRGLPAFPVHCPLSPHTPQGFFCVREARALPCVMHTVCTVALDIGMTTEPLSFAISLPAE